MAVNKNIGMQVDIGDEGNQIYQAMEQLTSAAMSRAHDLPGAHLPDVLYVGLNAVAGALRPVAAVLGFDPSGKGRVSDEEALATINPITMLVAALLTARVANVKPDGDTQMDYGPHQIFKAIDAAAKILGSDPRTKLNSKMVEAADSFKTPEYLGNSWNVENSPTSTEDERPRYLN